MFYNLPGRKWIAVSVNGLRVTFPETRHTVMAFSMTMLNEAVFKHGDNTNDETVRAIRGDRQKIRLPSIVKIRKCVQTAAVQRSTGGDHLHHADITTPVSRK